MINPAISKIAGFSFCGQTAKVFKNAYNFCGKIVAVFFKMKNCHKNYFKSAIIYCKSTCKLDLRLDSLSI